MLWWWHLVNAHEGKAGMVLFAGKTVWSMPERFECTTLAKKHYINTLPFLSLAAILDAFNSKNWTRGWRCFTKHKPHAGHWNGRKWRFLSLLTSTFDLDIQTRPSEGPNTSFMVSSSGGISYTNKKVTDSANNRTWCSSLRTVIITGVDYWLAIYSPKQVN